MEKGYSQVGQVSEWNEGNFKNLRLHEAQEMINIHKINPLKPIGFNRYHYHLWISAVNVLYGEGQSKYSDDEIKEINILKLDLDVSLAIYPPNLLVYYDSISGKKKKSVFSNKNWMKIREKIENYESRVKYFNELHGLSTRNVDYDLEGL